MDFDFRQGLGIFSRPFFTFIEAKWEEMRLALLQGDIEKATSYFVNSSQEEYRQIFRNLGEENIRVIFENMKDFEVDEILNRVAECGVSRVEETGEYSCPVSFILDGDGVWKILGF